MAESIASIVAQFNVPGNFHDARRYEAGHIHDTYRVETRINGQPKFFVLQRINDRVFRDPPGVMANIARVTQHLRSKLLERGCGDANRRVLEVIHTRDGTSYYCSAERGFWRMYGFVSGAHTVGDQPTPQEVFEAASGFGNFVGQLIDLPGPPLAETIPNFHHGPHRFQALVEAVNRDSHNRAVRARREIDLIRQSEWLLAEPQRLISQAAVPLRVVHNDAKSSNVLLDDPTGAALCVIDLDTVMTGLALYDFGDLVRTTVTGLPEDFRNAAAVKVQMPYLEAAVKGYLRGANGWLERCEIESLRTGPLYMALIMATRFLTDYLSGDEYYKAGYSEHNLDRCGTQLALLQSLLTHETYLAGLLSASQDAAK